MFKSIPSAAIVLFTFIISGTAISADSSSQKSDTGTRNPAIETIIQRYIRDSHFQGVVLVAQADKIVHHAAYGYSDREKQIANTVETRFLIGSLTKSFTAICALQLVEEGKLQLHAPLSRFLPDLRRDLGEKLSLHLLLKQQSGLPVHLERMTEQTESPVSSQDILTIINNSALSFTPGQRFEYSNLNYHLAAIVIERVSGKSFAEVLQQNIFAPLAMNNSGVERFGKRPANRANGYAATMFGIEQDENNVSWALGSGDIYSTIDDLYKWDQALTGDKLLKTASKALLFDGAGSALGYYGYGFRIQPYQRTAQHKDNGTVIRHGGSMDGFLSNYHHYQQDQMTVIVLGNIRPFNIRKMTFELKEAVFGATDRNRQHTAELE